MDNVIVAKEKNYVIDPAILEGVAEEVTIDANPGIEDRPRILDAFTRANAALIQPKLEALIQAYLQACSTTTGRAAARLFMQNVINAED